MLRKHYLIIWLCFYRTDEQHVCLLEQPFLLPEKYLITEAGRIQITQETRGYAPGFASITISRIPQREAVCCNNILEQFHIQSLVVNPPAPYSQRLLQDSACLNPLLTQ